MTLLLSVQYQDCLYETHAYNSLINVLPPLYSTTPHIHHHHHYGFPSSAHSYYELVDKHLVHCECRKMIGKCVWGSLIHYDKTIIVSRIAWSLKLSWYVEEKPGLSKACVYQIRSYSKLKGDKKKKKKKYYNWKRSTMSFSHVTCFSACTYEYCMTGQ